MFDAFLEALVGRHKDDPRIIAWDLCNEPYAFSWRDFPDIVKTETVWLKSLYNKCKELGAQAPITVGIWPGVPLEMVDSISDILSIHPYWKPQESREEYEENDPNQLDSRSGGPDFTLGRGRCGRTQVRY